MNQGLDYIMPEWILCYTDSLLLFFTLSTLLAVLINYRRLKRIEEWQRIKDVLEKEKTCNI